jgi:hypothetical protein
MFFVSAFILFIAVASLRRRETKLLAVTHFLGLTAIADQTNHKNNFESVASQRFQNYSWLGFEHKAL